MAANAVDWHSQIAKHFDGRYERSSRFRERASVWSALIASHIHPGDAVLDAGCGPGIFAIEAARQGGVVTAFDASPEMVTLALARAAQTAPPPRIHLAQLEDMARFGLACFDVAMCSSVLEYVEDLSAELLRLRAALKPDGILLVSVPNGNAIYRTLEAASFRLFGRPRYRAFVRHTPTPKAFEQDLAKAGFLVLSQQTFAPFPLVGGAFRRLGLRRRGDLMCVFAAKRASTVPA
jgi:2-polyprenyl-3-methyl-5-hydroxy-6-metoxy-1,4-benzoquinol methylase